MEAPQYSVKPKLGRALVPETIKLIVLSAIFYTGILVNLALLEISPPLMINVLVIMVLLLLVVIELIFIYVKNSRTAYNFYSDRVEIAGGKQRSLLYSEIKAPAIKRSIFDKSYKTGTIVLQPKFKIEHVEGPDEIFGYLQNLIAYQTGR